MSVYSKLQAARMKLQSMELKKSGHNKFAGYSYFELGDFLPPTQKIFAELGLCSVISFSPDLASLRVIDTEDNSEVLFTSPMGSAALKGCHEVQNIGAVETYQRRYLWVTAMEIVEHDALDSSEPVKEAKQAEKQQEVKAVKIIPTAGALESLTNEQRTKVEKLAVLVASAHAAGNEWGAYETYSTADLDADEKVGLWSLLNSKVRSSLKQLREQEAATA